MADWGPHVGEFAELYALGALEPEERAQIDAHAAACVACTRALGAAEAVVVALDDVFVEQHEPGERLGARIAASARTTLPRPVRSFPRSVLALAAAVVLAAGIGGGVAIERATEVARDARDSAVLATIATSHFEHVSFTARTAGAPIGKAIYARDGTWVYVVVDSATCGCRAVARSASGERDLGTPDVRGNTATLFVRGNPRPSWLALEDASGRVIADATLAYPAP